MNRETGSGRGNSMNHLIITVPIYPPNWNEYNYANRSNPYKGAAMERREKQIAKIASHGKKWTGGYPVALIVRPHFRAKNRDLDNVKIKGMLDGIVAAGVLENDNLTHIQAIHIYPVFDRQDIVEFEIRKLEAADGE